MAEENANKKKLSNYRPWHGPWTIGGVVRFLLMATTTTTGSVARHGDEG